MLIHNAKRNLPFNPYFGLLYARPPMGPKIWGAKISNLLLISIERHIFKVGGHTPAPTIGGPEKFSEILGFINKVKRSNIKFLI